MSQNRFPPGWDEERVRRLIERYESQTEDEAVAEDEAAMQPKRRLFDELMSGVAAIKDHREGRMKLRTHGVEPPVVPPVKPQR